MGGPGAPAVLGAAPHVPLSHLQCPSPPPPFQAPRPGRKCGFLHPAGLCLSQAGRTSCFHRAAGLLPTSSDGVVLPGRTARFWGDGWPLAPQVHRGPDLGRSRGAVCRSAPQRLSGAGSPGPSRSGLWGLCRHSHGALPVPPGQGWAHSECLRGPLCPPSRQTPEGLALASHLPIAGSAGLPGASHPQACLRGDSRTAGRSHDCPPCPACGPSVKGCLPGLEAQQCPVTNGETGARRGVGRGRGSPGPACVCLSPRCCFASSPNPLPDCGPG